MELLGEVAERERFLGDVHWYDLPDDDAAPDGPPDPVRPASRRWFARSG
ncbi:hypothetical protein [Thermoactinospora rubra]|nr:hypothetical protein [Thermoactinospora rubra]